MGRRPKYSILAGLFGGFGDALSERQRLKEKYSDKEVDILEKLSQISLNQQLKNMDPSRALDMRYKEALINRLEHPTEKSYKPSKEDYANEYLQQRQEQLEQQNQGAIQQNKAEATQKLQEWFLPQTVTQPPETHKLENFGRFFLGKPALPDTPPNPPQPDIQGLLNRGVRDVPETINSERMGILRNYAGAGKLSPVESKQVSDIIAQKRTLSAAMRKAKTAEEKQVIGEQATDLVERAVQFAGDVQTALEMGLVTQDEIDMLDTLETD